MANGMAAMRASCPRCLSTCSTTVVGTLEVCQGDFVLEWRRLRRLPRGLRRHVCSVCVLCRSTMALAGRGEALLGVRAACGREYHSVDFSRIKIGRYLCD